MKKEKEQFKKSMHEDELVSFAAKVVEYFKNPANTKKWLDILFYVVIGIVALFMFRNCQVNKENTVKNKLGPAEYKFINGDYEGVIPLLNDINKDYPNTKFSGQALYYLGEANYRLGKYDEAVKAFEAGKKKYLPDLMKPLVYMSLGYSYEAQKNYLKAAETFEEALKVFPNHYSRDEVLVNAARSLRLAGKNDEARARYEEILNKYPNSQWIDTAKQNLGR